MDRKAPTNATAMAYFQLPVKRYENDEKMVEETKKKRNRDQLTFDVSKKCDSFFRCAYDLIRFLQQNALFDLTWSIVGGSQIINAWAGLTWNRLV